MKKTTLSLSYIALILSTLCFGAENIKNEVLVDMKNASYKHGALTTTDGGVLCTGKLRVQAQNIRYEKQCGIEIIKASGHLAVVRNNQVFLGDSFFYDVASHTGYLKNGTTQAGEWFITADQINFLADGDYVIENSAITTSESGKGIWRIESGKSTVSKDLILKTQSVTGKLCGVPVMWLPSSCNDLKEWKDPPGRITTRWNNRLGMSQSLRYRFFSNKQHAIYGRIDYNKKNKFGGGIETVSRSKDKKSSLITRSFATDNKVKNGMRYRFQGSLKHTSTSGKTRFITSYDVLSDEEMISDFIQADFEKNVRKETFFEVSHTHPRMVSLIRFVPRVNRFQTVKQELPTLFLASKPYVLGETSFVFENSLKASYLDYTYAHSIKKDLIGEEAGRVAYGASLYGPLQLGHFHLVPEATFKSVFYTDSPDNSANWQMIGKYGCLLKTSLIKQFPKTTHIAEPYAEFKGSTPALTSLSNTYLFSIDDAIFYYHTIRAGVKNSFFRENQNNLIPQIDADFYFLSYIDGETYKKSIPKCFAQLQINHDRLEWDTVFGWNIDRSTVEEVNSSIRYTLNRNCAFGVEFRHRSKYAWRRLDRENPFLEIKRDLSELLDSPLSDRRNTVLTKASIFLSPRIKLNVESRHGFGRKKEPGYTTFKTDLVYLISSYWEFKLGYQQSPQSNRLSANLRLISK